MHYALVSRRARGNHKHDPLTFSLTEVKLLVLVSESGSRGALDPKNLVCIRFQKRHGLVSTNDNVFLLHFGVTGYVTELVLGFP